MALRPLRRPRRLRSPPARVAALSRLAYCAAGGVQPAVPVAPGALSAGRTPAQVDVRLHAPELEAVRRTVKHPWSRALPDVERLAPTSSRTLASMRPLRYSINVTLDGCCDHRAIPADEDLHRHAAEGIAQADALLFGRVTYEMMEAAWRPPARTGVRPDWMADWMEPFARTIDAAKKYVVSSTLDRVDWNAELVRGDHLGNAVQQLKRESGKGLFVGGVKLPLALAELGLIDEYEFVVQPRLAGHGPTLFAGLSKHIDLKLVSRLEFGSGAVAMRYEPRR